MENSDQLRFFFAQFAPQLPVLFVSLIACVVLIVKWKQAAPGSLWAMLGFGLTLILCFVIPIAQTGTQKWVMDGSGSISQRISVLAGLSFFWSLLHAISYALLLVGVVAGRHAPLHPLHQAPHQPTPHPPSY